MTVFRLGVLLLMSQGHAPHGMRTCATMSCAAPIQGYAGKDSLTLTCGDWAMEAISAAVGIMVERQ